MLNNCRALLQQIEGIETDFEEQVDCAYCDGSGVITEDGQTGTTCEECKGTGKFLIPQTVEEMPEESFIKRITVAEQTGGNIYNDIIYLKNGSVVLINGDGIFIFRDEEHFEDDNDIKHYIFD